MAMKRTQLYLDGEMARTLGTLGRQKGKTVSELVREGVEEKYMSRKDLDGECNENYLDNPFSCGS